MSGLGVSSPPGVARAWLAAIALVGTASVASCSPDAEPAECSGQPAFVLTVTAQGGGLPTDLELEVRYGGSQKPETYRLVAPHEPEVVFCTVAPVTAETGAAASGAGGAPGEPESLACRLWTEGPANVVLRADGFPPLMVDLQVDADRCTVTESVELMRGDGGADS